MAAHPRQQPKYLRCLGYCCLDLPHALYQLPRLAHLSDCNGWSASVGACRAFEELASLVDAKQRNPALPPGHPFQGVQNTSYWSATIDEKGATNVMPSVFPMVRSSEREKTTVCNSGVCAARQACRTCLPDTGAAPTTDRDGSVHALCTGPLRTRFQQLRVELSLRVSHDFPEQHSVKQLLLRDAYSDIAQKHLASKFSFATDHRGRWDRMMKERPNGQPCIHLPR